MDDHYSTEDCARFREMFAPQAERYRRYSRRTLAMVVIVFIEWVAAIKLLLKPRVFWIRDVPMILFFGIFIYGLFGEPPLECPACHHQLNSRELQRFCPECGSDQLMMGGWLQPPRCGSCGKKMRRRRSGGFYYKIRACT